MQRKETAHSRMVSLNTHTNNTRVKRNNTGTLKSSKQQITPIVFPSSHMLPSGIWNESFLAPTPGLCGKDKGKEPREEKLLTEQTQSAQSS